MPNWAVVLTRTLQLYIVAFRSQHMYLACFDYIDIHEVTQSANEAIQQICR